MAASILKRLAGPAQVSNAAATKYTVAAATKAVIRHVHVYNASGSAATFTMSIGTDAAATRVWDAVSVAANAEFSRFVYFPLEPAEIVQALSGTNNVLTLTISGDERPLG